MRAKFKKRNILEFIFFIYLISHSGLLSQSSLLYRSQHAGNAFNFKKGSSVSLRSLTLRHGLMLGLGGIADLAEYSDHSKKIIANEFNFLVPGRYMKWKWIHPQKEIWSWTRFDELVNFAQRNSQQVKGHTIIWHRSLPPYMEEGKFNWKDFEDHIIRLMSRFKKHKTLDGKKLIFAWDVVNEAIGDLNMYGRIGFRETIFKKNLGEDYVERAFFIARRTDPDALLIYNDYGLELPGPKAEFALEWLKRSKQKNVPIDAIGFQTHISLWGPKTLAKFEQNIRKFTDLGFKIFFSEVDVTIYTSEQDFRSLDEDQKFERLKKQGFVYSNLFKICMKNKSCVGISLWGLSDRFSWIRRGLQKTYEKPLLFDEYLKKKPAYWNIHNLLSDEPS